MKYLICTLEYATVPIWVSRILKGQHGLLDIVGCYSVVAEYDGGFQATGSQKYRSVTDLGGGGGGG